MKKCEVCGNLGESKFCPECGGRMVDITNDDELDKVNTNKKDEELSEDTNSLNSEEQNDNNLLDGENEDVDNSLTEEKDDNSEADDSVSKLIDQFESVWNKNKKKIIIGIVVLVIIICLIGGCNSKMRGSSDYSSQSSSSNYSSSSSYSSDSYSYEMSESDAEDWAAIYLARQLSEDKYQYNGSKSMAAYDIGSTRYSVGTITSDGNGGYVVKGTFSLYDAYGQISSSHYNEKFEVHVYSDYDATVTTFLGTDNYY